MEQWRKNMIVLTIAFFVMNIGYNVVLPFLPQYLAADLGVTDPIMIKRWNGLIYGASYFSMIFFTPLWGLIADRTNRKLMLLRSSVGMAITMSLMAFCRTPFELLAMRFLNGTISGFVPAGNTLMSTNTPREKIGFALGTMQAGSLAGAIFGPVVGGLFVSFLPFHYAFLISGGICACVSVLMFFYIKEMNKPKRDQNKIGFFEGFRLAFGHKPLPTVFIASTMMQFAVIGTNAFLSIFVSEMPLGHLDLAFYITLATTVTGVNSVIAAPLFGRVIDRFGPEKLVSYAFAAGGFFLLLQSISHSYGMLLCGRFLFGLALGGLAPSINSLVAKYSICGMESSVFSYNTSFISIGMMSGPWLGGLIAGGTSTAGLFAVCGCALLFNSLWLRHGLKQVAAEKQIPVSNA